MDSHRPRQISQSDCEISSNCGKIVNGVPMNRNQREKLLFNFGTRDVLVHVAWASAVKIVK